jgi:hypothetical protein
MGVSQRGEESLYEISNDNADGAVNGATMTIQLERPEYCYVTIFMNMSAVELLLQLGLHHHGLSTSWQHASVASYG